MNARARSNAVPPHAFSIATLFALAAIALAPVGALANPTLGFVEEFPGTSTSSWSGGSNFSNPGAGGLQGPADGYLLIQTGSPSSLGIRSFDASYSGDWIAAGVTQVQVWLNDVGSDDALEMHFSIGDGASNFWQYNVGFLPPLHEWGLYVVDLTSGANWTQIQGTGSFTAALSSVDRIHIRHDLPPFLMIPEAPDPVAGDVGIDHVLLTDGLVSVDDARPRVPRPVELATPYPNPSRGPVSLVVRGADSGPIVFQVLDAAGRSVRRAELARSGEETRVWLWDGLDDGGRRVPPGVYRVRATGPSGGTSRPLVRVE